MGEYREWKEGVNSRGYEYMVCEKNHVTLPELKKDLKILNNGYLGNEDIPDYPDYVFEEANVCHVTELSGLVRILEDEGFKRGKDNYLWWGLSAPRQNMTRFPEEFATSPAFQTKSLYGNFRFTFTFRELLREYCKCYNYYCPKLRVLDTKVYKKEIVYSILVHPYYMSHYRRYPSLPIDAQRVCGYSKEKKKILWRCQSPADNYTYYKDGSRLQHETYYVWDNVNVAFHLKKDWVLHFDRRQLLNNLSVCERAGRLLKEPKMSLEKAEAEVRRLKRYYNFE